MQVNATLIAAQQAAREAQVRFQQTHGPRASFAAALDPAAKADGFSPLPLKQTAPSATPMAETAPSPDARTARLGTLLDIKI